MRTISLGTHCEEAHLDFRPQDEERLHVIWTLGGEQRLFVLPGSVTGTFHRYSQGPGRLSFKLPVAWGGRAREGEGHSPLSTNNQGQLQIHVQLAPPHRSRPRLVRATNHVVPPDERRLDFLFQHGDHEIRLSFVLPVDLAVEGFQEQRDQRPLFCSLPPLAQMAAFLKAALRRNLAIPARLQQLAEVGSPQTRDLAARMAVLFPDEESWLAPEALALKSLLPDRPLGEMAALAYFLDLERGALEESEIRRAAHFGSPLPLTALSAFAVTRQLLRNVTPQQWDEAFPEDPYQDCLQASLRAPFPQLRQQLLRGSEQKPIAEILAQLARESNSRRCQSFLSKCQGEFPVNDEQISLRYLLAGQGVALCQSLVTALALYVDIEAGLLTPERLSSDFDSSLYALVAVARAADVPLRVFALPCLPGDEGRSFLTRLCLLSGGALVGQFETQGPGGERGSWLEPLGSPEEVEQQLQGPLPFSGTALVCLNELDRLSPADLELLRSQGPVAACYEDESSGNWLWSQQGDGAQLEVLGRRLRFRGQVLARTRPGPLGETPDLRVDLDQRNSPHYRWGGLQPEEPGHRGSGLVVELPELEGLPVHWHELSEAALLGRGHELLEEARSLAQLRQALERLLTWKTAYYRIPSSLLAEAREEWPELPEGPWEGRGALVELAECDPGYLAQELRAFVEFAEPPVEFLRSQLNHPLPLLRRNAARLVVRQGSGDPLDLEFELMRLRHDPSPAVQEAAHDSLAQLALRGVIAPPTPLRLPDLKARPGGKRERFLIKELKGLGLSPARAHAEASWLAGLEQALEGTTRVVLLDDEAVQQVRRTAVRAWSELARGRECRLVHLEPQGGRRDDKPHWEEPPGTPAVLQPGRLPLLDLLAAGGSRVRVVRSQTAFDPWTAEIYQPRRQRFVSLMHPFCLTYEEVGQTEQEWDDYELLLSWYPHTDLDLRWIARKLTHAFELPPECRVEVLKLLMEIGRRSVLDF